MEENKNPFLTDEKRIRFAKILKEILGLMYPMHQEIIQEKASKEYLREKMEGINRDIGVLNGLLEDRGDEENE